MEGELLPRSNSSPDASLSKVFKQRRRSKVPDDASAISTTPSETLSVDRGGLLRSSIDRGIGKIRDRARGTTDEDFERRDSHDSTIAGSSRLSKLVHSTSRRRRKKEKATEEEEGGEGLGLRHAYTTGADGSELANNSSSPSVNSFGHSKSAASSLFTEDSDPEPAARPTLVSRPSHTGYLTLSSPLIAAQTVGTPPPIPIIVTDEHTASDGVAVDPAPVVAADSTKSPADEADRTASPVGKIRSTFASRAASPEKERLGSIVDSPVSIASFFGTRKDTGTASTPQSPTKPAPPKLATDSPKTEVPSTLVTPATPELPDAATLQKSSPSPKLTPLQPLAHRRTRSAAAAPSKLSLSSAPPLTPAPEEVKTPGGSLVQPSGSGGFFSSVISATQNAGNQFSNFFSLPSATSGTRSRSGTGPAQLEQTGSTGGEEVILSASQKSNVAPKEPAVATLGKGNLSLSHLGISEGSSDASMTSKDENGEDSVQLPAIIQDTATSNESEEASAADAINTAYTGKSGGGRSASVADQQSVNGRPRSLGSGGRATLTGDSTPPISIVNGKDGGAIHRSGSVRSRISDRRKRHRNSSAATGGTIATALGATGAAIANPAGSNKRLTGFAVANQKRNKDFHGFFKSVPEDDYLIEDYSAALQREILLHGRLYISERNICFSSNIMGYVTTLVINFDEVMAMEKRNTAMIFPNAIMIQTLHAKNVFASFLNRDSAYELLLNIWKIKHPNLKVIENGHAIDTSSPAKSDIRESEEEDEDDSDGDSGDDDDNYSGSYMNGGGTSIAGSDVGDASRAGTLRQISLAQSMNPTANGGLVKTPSSEGLTGGGIADDFSGPATHAPTECSDSDTHYEKLVLDDTVPAPLGKVYSMMFGAASGVCIKKFLEEQESGDIQYEDDRKGMNETVRSFSYSYIKKLTASIGPRQTKCLVNQSLDAFDLEKAVSVTCSTQTPDVPSGNVFVTKTRYCLMWGPGNSTRILMSSGVEWSGKSWFKGPIEKGAEQGQAEHGRDLVTFLKAQLSARSPVKSTRGRGKGRKKKSDSQGTGAVVNPTKTASSKSAVSSHWGPLEPLRAVGDAVSGALGPMFNTTGILGILLVLVSFLWLRQAYADPSSSTVDRAGRTAHRASGYEDIWRREENDLWNWLESRLHLDDVYGVGRSGSVSSQSQKVLREKGTGTDADLEEQMNQRQLDDAIRVTEKRLAQLKASIERKRRTSSREA